MITTKLAALGTAALVLVAAGPALAQQQGSAGMDEIDASLSAESGDMMDYDRSQNEIMMRMNQNARDMNDRIGDLEERIRRLEEGQRNQ